MQPPRYVSTAAVSRALGVSVTTVKRWVDEGRLPAHRTAGGHRKILLDDVLRLVRQENWPHVNLAGLTGAGGAGSPATGPLSQQLYEALLRGEVQASREVLLGAYHAGLGSGCLADEVIAPAMARVGHGWE